MDFLIVSFMITVNFVNMTRVKACEILIDTKKHGEGKFKLEMFYILNEMRMMLDVRPIETV